MGADGHLILLDANKCDAAGFDPCAFFGQVYENVLFERRIYTVYWDTERIDLQNMDPDVTGRMADEALERCEAEGWTIAHWEVWT